MNPAQPIASPNEQPVVAPPTPRLSHRRLVGLWLLIGPTALIIASIILFAVANFVLASHSSASDLFNAPSLAQHIVNIILFLIGAIATITWLPGLIIGIVLLGTQKK